MTETIKVNINWDEGLVWLNDNPDKDLAQFMWQDNESLTWAIHGLVTRWLDEEE